jgi:hypothetical protein
LIYKYKMEKEIHKSRYVSVLFDDETRMYTSKYLPDTENMTDKEWQEQMIELRNLIEKYRPLNIIDDNIERKYSYSPDMQVWTLQLFVNSWNKIGLKKYVQIIPDEIIGKLTSEQIEEFAMNDFKMQFKHKFVSDYQSAIEYIKDE